MDIHSFYCFALFVLSSAIRCPGFTNVIPVASIEWLSYPCPFFSESHQSSPFSRSRVPTVVNGSALLLWSTCFPLAVGNRIILLWSCRRSVFSGDGGGDGGSKCSSKVAFSPINCIFCPGVEPETPREIGLHRVPFDRLIPPPAIPRKQNSNLVFAWTRKSEENQAVDAY